jgi:single-stranded-DNA-specific exonuclease
MDWFPEQGNGALIVMPDSSSNDYEQHKELKERGYDILVLDHHEADHYSEDAVVVNN